MKYQHCLVAKADNTFLWVALVCEELRKTHEWQILDVLKDIPPGLKELYTRKMKKIQGLKQKPREFCRTILATVSTAYGPLGLEELRALAGLPPIVTKRSTAELVSMCDSFLTLQDEVVGFVYQSAKEFLLENRIDLRTDLQGITLALPDLLLYAYYLRLYFEDPCWGFNRLCLCLSGLWLHYD